MGTEKKEGSSAEAARRRRRGPRTYGSIFLRVGVTFVGALTVVSLGLFGQLRLVDVVFAFRHFGFGWLDFFCATVSGLGPHSHFTHRTLWAEAALAGALLLAGHSRFFYDTLGSSAK